MQSNLPSIKRRVKLNLSKDGTSVILTWKSYVGGTLDPVTQQHVGAVATDQTLTIKAFVHSAGSVSAVRQYAEIEVGDLIVDFAYDAPLDGKEALRFTIDGQQYEQKKVSQKLAKAWDVVQRNQRLYRTVLLEKVT